MTRRALPTCLAGNHQACSSPDFKAGAHVNKVKQLTLVNLQPAHSTQAESGAGHHQVGPGRAMDAEFPAIIVMEGQITITDWTRWAAELLARSELF